jgi:hypothetical protein
LWRLIRNFQPLNILINKSFKDYIKKFNKYQFKKRNNIIINHNIKIWKKDYNLVNQWYIMTIKKIDDFILNNDNIEEDFINEEI